MKSLLQISKLFSVGSLSTMDAILSMIDKLVHNFEKNGTIIGYTFSSIVSEMATMSEPELALSFEFINAGLTSILFNM